MGVHRPSGYRQVLSVGDRVSLRAEPGIMGIVETTPQHEGDTVKVYVGTIDHIKYYRTLPVIDLIMLPEYAQIRRCVGCGEWILTGKECDWCSTQTKIGKDETP